MMTTTSPWYRESSNQSVNRCCFELLYLGRHDDSDGYDDSDGMVILMAMMIIG